MFTTAKCGHCGKIGTKIETIEPNGAQYKQTAICCMHCNSILGVTDFYNAGTLLKKAETERAAMSKKIGDLQSQLDQVLRALRR